MYNDNYEMVLAHHGVKGMKWGVRKKRQEVRSEARTRYDNAKAANKQAKRDYNKAYNKAVGRANTYGVFQNVTKKGRAKTNALWEDAYNKAEAANKAKSDYKNAKKELRAEKKANGSGLSDKQKTVLAAATAATATALIGYSAYKVSKVVGNKQNVSAGKSFVEATSKVAANSVRNKSFAEMNSKEKQAMLNQAVSIAAKNGAKYTDGGYTDILDMCLHLVPDVNEYANHINPFRR